MTTPTDNPEVIAANRAGRLHPSQRRVVIDGMFWTFLAIAVVFVLLLVVLPLTTDVLHGSQRGQSLAGGVFIILLVVACLVFCLRRYLDLHRPLLVVTGWTHDFGEAPATDAYPIGLHFYPGGFKSVPRREVRVGGVTYSATETMWKTIQPERNNTICVLPRTKLIVNVFPA